jgi:hypothetical protein
MGISVDRKGRRVSELAGAGAPAQSKPPPPALAAKLAATTYSAWLWHGWAWDSRAMCWRAEWHHRSHPLTVRDYDEYVAGTLNYRHWRTAATPNELLESFFPI